MINTKPGIISPFQLFTLLLTSRISGLAVTNEITVFGFLFQFALSFVLSGAAYVISKTNRISGKVRRAYLTVFCILLTGATVFTLLDFKERAISLNVPDVFAAVLLCSAVLYSASLGMEAVARFSQFSAFIIVAAVFLGTAVNIRRVNNFSEIRPEIYGISPLSIIKCFDIPVLYLLYSPYVKGKKEKALAGSVIASYSVSFVLYLICFFVLKSSAEYYPYPVFTLFQLGEIGSYNKLDILFTAPLVCALFVKLSAYLVRVKNENC